MIGENGVYTLNDLYANVKLAIYRYVKEFIIFARRDFYLKKPTNRGPFPKGLPKKKVSKTGFTT